MNILRLHIILFIFFLGDVQAQPFDINNSLGDFGVDYFQLAPDFAARNGIRQQEITFMRKLPDKPMEDLKEMILLEYNRNGRMIKELIVKPNLHRSDTSIKRWYYDRDELKYMEKTDVLGLYREEYEYPANDSLVIERWRNDVLISIESIKTHQVNDTLTIKRFYNESGVHYKTFRDYSRKDGRQARKSLEFQFTGKTSEESFRYNEKGRVEAYTRKGNGKDITKEFEYSDIGELIYVSVLSNAKKKSKLEFLYEDGLPDAYIKVDKESRHMRIAKFEFERESFR